MNSLFLSDINGKLESVPIRKGFGVGLVKAAELDENVVAL